MPNIGIKAPLARRREGVSSAGVAAFKHQGKTNSRHLLAPTISDQRGFSTEQKPIQCLRQLLASTLLHGPANYRRPPRMARTRGVSTLVTDSGWHLKPLETPQSRRSAVERLKKQCKDNSPIPQTHIMPSSGVVLGPACPATTD